MDFKAEGSKAEGSKAEGSIAEYKEARTETGGEAAKEMV